MRKYRCCIFSFLTSAVILIALSIFLLLFLEKLQTEKGKKSAYLTKANEPYWTKDAGFNRDFYLYNCTNSQDVIYTNAKPEFQEVGPYKYREY